MFFHKHEYKFTKYAFLFKSNTKDTYETNLLNFNEDFILEWNSV